MPFFSHAPPVDPVAIHQPVPQNPNVASSNRQTWSASPSREIVEITSSLTTNNLSKYRALARAKRKLMFVARRTDENQLAMHSLKQDGKSTPDVIVFKDNQVQALTSSEANQLLNK